MPLWHNKDKSENPCVARSWLVCPYSFSNKSPAKNRHNKVSPKVRCNVKDKGNVYLPSRERTVSRLGAFYPQVTGRYAHPAAFGGSCTDRPARVSPGTS